MSLLLKSSSFRSSSRPDDLFAEFTSFRDNLKKQYVEKLSKPISSSTAKQQLQISATKAKLLTESKFGIENLKQNIKDISKTQDDEKKLTVEKKNDFLSMIKDFEGRIGKTNTALKESRLGSSLKFRTSSANLNMLEPTPRKEESTAKALTFFDSSAKKSLKTFNSLENKLPRNRIIEMQNFISMTTDDELNNLPQNYIEELVKLSSNILQKVKRTQFYSRKYF